MLGLPPIKSSDLGAYLQRALDEWRRALLQRDEEIDVPQWTRGTGTPEGAVTAPVGSVFFRTDGASGTLLYVKQTGTGNTGWVAV